MQGARYVHWRKPTSITSGTVDERATTRLARAQERAARAFRMRVKVHEQHSHRSG